MEDSAPEWKPGETTCCISKYGRDSDGNPVLIKRLYFARPGYTVGGVTSYTSSFKTKLFEAPLVAFNAENRYVIDMGCTESINLTVFHNMPEYINDEQADPEFWSPGKWIEEVKEFFNGWQNLNCDNEGNISGGFTFEFYPPDESLFPPVIKNVFLTSGISVPYGFGVTKLNIPLVVATMQVAKDYESTKLRFTYRSNRTGRDNTFVKTVYSGISDRYPDAPSDALSGKGQWAPYIKVGDTVVIGEARYYAGTQFTGLNENETGSFVWMTDGSGIKLLRRMVFTEPGTYEFELRGLLAYGFRMIGAGSGARDGERSGRTGAYINYLFAGGTAGDKCAGGPIEVNNNKGAYIVKIVVGQSPSRGKDGDLSGGYSSLTLSSGDDESVTWRADGGILKYITTEGEDVGRYETSGRPCVLGAHAVISSGNSPFVSANTIKGMLGGHAIVGNESYIPPLDSAYNREFRLEPVDTSYIDNYTTRVYNLGGLNVFGFEWNSMLQEDSIVCKYKGEEGSGEREVDVYVQSDSMNTSTNWSTVGEFGGKYGGGGTASLATVEHETSNGFNSQNDKAYKGGDGVVVLYFTRAGDIA